MRRVVAVLMIMILSFSLFADPIEFDYEPYEEDEFPVWLSEIRRAESIFFGSLVITFPLTAAGYSIASGLGADINDNQFQLFWVQLGVASCLSLAIVGIDWLIGYLSD